MRGDTGSLSDGRYRESEWEEIQRVSVRGNAESLSEVEIQRVRVRGDRVGLSEMRYRESE